MLTGRGLAVALVAAAIAAACAAGGEGERPPQPSVKGGEFGTPGCFLRQSVQDFEALDDRNLIIFAPGKADAYHVQVSPPDGQLRFAVRLAFESSDSRVCGYGGDTLILAEGGGGPERLSITGVYRLDATALQGLELRFGRKVAPRATAPEPGPGAEIERKPDPGPRN